MTMTALSRRPGATQIGPVDKTVEVNGLTLHYVDWGWNAKEIILCLHGVTGNARQWESFAAATRTAYRVYALDQRGHGDSEHAADYGTASWVSDILGFLDALQIEKVILVGASMGGHNSMAFAARHPERVSALVIVDLAPGKWSPPANRPAQPAEFDSIDEIVAMNVAANPQTPLEQHRLRAETGTKLLSNGKLAFKVDPRLPDAWAPDDLWGEIANIAAPVLIMRGGISQAFTREDGERMAKTMPKATFREFSGAGHSIQNDQPSSFTAAVTAFLNG
ncbi:MAG: alpha/beta hydrolase [Chloroflexi bacterium]|nr:alpha/beta hydrolase [Chloroflexota bacterium]